MTIVLDDVLRVTDSDAPGRRVLQCLSDLNPSRQTRQAISATRGLMAAGGQSFVASGGGRLEAQMHRAGAQVLPFQPQRAGVFQARTNLDLLEVMAGLDLDLAHLHGLGEAQGVKALTDAANLPLVQTLHEVPEAAGFFQRRATRRHLVGDRLIAVSQFLADEITRTFPVMAERLSVVPPGFDLDALSDQAVSPQRTIALAEKWGLIEDPSPVILVVDACLETRWLATLDQAHAAHPGALWILLGEEESTAPALPPRMRWISGSDDLPAAMKLASVVVSAPDLPVAACDAALEAQAMGKPVIVTDIGAGAESLDPERSGWLVPPGNGVALGAAVAQALALDDSQRAHIGLAGRVFVQSHFSLDQAHTRLDAVYDTLLPRR